MRPSFPTAPRAILLAAAAAMTALYVLLLRARHGALVDDAYISFRYAARWASGKGWTWNDGQVVEGFSNPLWTVLLGVVDRAGGPAPDGTAPALGLLFLLAALGALPGLAGPRAWPRSAVALAAGVVALDVGLVLWAGSGLEVALAAALVAGTLWAAALPLRSPGGGFRLGLLSAGLALVRPEGTVWAAWVAVWLVWGAWAPLRTLGGWALGMAPAWGYLGYRLLHFGSAVPNTFYAKMEPTFLGVPAGAATVAGWAVAHAVPLALIAWAWWRRDRRRDPAGTRAWALLPTGWIGLQILFTVAAGGDWMGRMRYLAPMVPALGALLGEAWSRQAHPSAGVGRLGRALLAVTLGLHAAAGALGRDRIPSYTRQGRTLGLWLAQVAAPGDTVAVTAAGAIPYYAGLTALDVLGINDPAVRSRPARHTGTWAPGHHRYDVQQLLERPPAWIVWDFGVRVNRYRLRQLSATEAPESLDYRRDLLARPEFAARYAIDGSAPLVTQDAYTVFRRR
jgi:hypothetical protein